MMLGSFAEQLILRSEIPVMIVGTHSRDWTPEAIHVLVANDLSDPDAPFFNQTFNFAEQLGADLTLFSCVPRPLEAVLQSGVFLFGGGWMPTPIYLENEKSRLKKIGATVADRARQMGLQCNVAVDDTSNSITDSILKHAKENKTNFIAMTSESGPVSSSLLGSITRQVVRAATCPVIVFREHRRKDTMIF
jgi:nucleotide-binding universal stress UspA family protein